MFLMIPPLRLQHVFTYVTRSSLHMYISYSLKMYFGSVEHAKSRRKENLLKDYCGLF
jgi:hypothetical protein